MMAFVSMVIISYYKYFTLFSTNYKFHYTHIKFKNHKNVCVQVFKNNQGMQLYHRTEP